MTTITVGILGLGRIGTSFGLALKRAAARKESRQQFHITGYDSNTDAADAAKRKGALDSFTRTAADAARDKDIVILALSYGETHGVYRVLADVVRSGAVVLDTSPLKLPSIEWAEKYLPAEAHMIGVTPILNPDYLLDGADDIDHAAADLFDRGALLVTPGAKSQKDAVELAADLAQLIGATPRFVDPGEHDGWIASMEALPALLGVAVFHTLRENKAWDDARRAGNPSFGRLTHHLFDTHPDDLRDLLLYDRANIVYQIDQLTETLRQVRQILAENNRPALEELLINSNKAYVEWYNRRQSGKWDDAGQQQRPQAGAAIMSGFLGGYLSKRIRGDKDEDND